MSDLDLDGQSLAVKFSTLTQEERNEVLSGMDRLTIETVSKSWRVERRAAQTPPPGRWFMWPIKGGRGSGKTRSATEWVTERVEAGSTWLHLLSRTHADVRDTMIQGESGLIEVAHSHGIEAVYESSKRRLWYPDHKAQALMFGAQEPDESRGPQCETSWVDEFSTFPKKVDRVGNTALTNLVMGCRLGNDPRMCITFTPKSIPDVKRLIDRANDPADWRVQMTEMSLYDNIANLPDTFIDEVLSAYRGTRLEAQEIFGHYLDAVEGALWTPELIDRERVDDHPMLAKIVVGVDPPGEANTECGIVVVGLEASNSTRKSAYVLADLSIRGATEIWAKRVIEARDMFGASEIVAEKNYGGDMVRAVIQAFDADARVRKVTAHEGKRARAEPVELLYETSRVHHVGSITQFLAMEGEMTGWDPDDKDAPSPNRLDALVWAVSWLIPSMSQRPATSSTAADLRIGGGIVR